MLILGPDSGSSQNLNNLIFVRYRFSSCCYDSSVSKISGVSSLFTDGRISVNWLLQTTTQFLIWLFKLKTTCITIYFLFWSQNITAGHNGHELNGQPLPSQWGGQMECLSRFQGWSSSRGSGGMKFPRNWRTIYKWKWSFWHLMALVNKYVDFNCNGFMYSDKELEDPVTPGWVSKHYCLTQWWGECVQIQRRALARVGWATPLLPILVRRGHMVEGQGPVTEAFCICWSANSVLLSVHTAALYIPQSGQHQTTDQLHDPCCARHTAIAVWKKQLLAT